MAEYLAEDLSAEVQAKMDELAQKGNQLEKQGRFTEAVQAWQAGLALIPEPQQFYGQTVWFLAAIGDVYFQQGEYALAHECFDKARGNMTGAGYGNPFIMLRLGECCLEIGDEKNALEYLLRAYMFEDKDIFDSDDETKYFEFLRTHIDLGLEND